MRRSVKRLAAVAFVMALILSACSPAGSEGEDTTAPPAGETTTTVGDTPGTTMGDATDTTVGEDPVVAEAKAAVAELVKVPKPRELEPFTPLADQHIFAITCALEIPGCTNFLNAVIEASDTIGYTVDNCSLGNTEQEARLCFNQAADSGADAIIIHGTGKTVAGYGYEQIADTGIPLFGNYTGNEPGSDPNIPGELNGETCLEQGKQTGEWLIAQTDGTANVVMYYTPFFLCVQQRADELEKALSVCDGCTLELKEVALENLGQPLSNQVQADVQANPDIDYVVGGFDAMALFASTGIRAAGRIGEVGAIGYDGDEPNVTAMKQDEGIAASLLSGFGEDGWIMVDMIARYLSGLDIPPGVFGSLWIMTPDTAEEATGGAPVWLGPTGYQDAYAAAWGKQWEG